MPFHPQKCFRDVKNDFIFKMFKFCLFRHLVRWIGLLSYFLSRAYEAFQSEFRINIKIVLSPTIWYSENTNFRRRKVAFGSLSRFPAQYKARRIYVRGRGTQICLWVWEGLPTFLPTFLPPLCRLNCGGLTNNYQFLLTICIYSWKLLLSFLLPFPARIRICIRSFFMIIVCT